MVWGDVEKMGPALAVAMLTILYGYIINLVTIALTEISPYSEEGSGQLVI